ncbi:hypothetical protein LTR70_003098 [Exophiala xenobiotica]|uniref:Uncharacterized protein n=1 Tax=Lithohypha guttulata TaxID=1690604 RepID=A0ABR0KH68_9EURO|nr:hypothetical protein LTR24_002669 [Lithohypha guttulata]KAK5323809.1 hypothetical protein LTR70_003098 [Exophiala xenobiotica]
MNADLLWVNKDSTSDHLSRSSKAETARIRAHVQHLSIQSRTRRKSVPPSRSARKNSKSVVDHQRPSKVQLAEPQEHEEDDQAYSRSLEDKAQDSRLFASGALTWLPAATPEEKRSFLFFLKRTAQEWSGYRDVSFWNILVPQASAAHLSIFHSVTALGALHESLENTHDHDKEKNLQQLLWQQCFKAAQVANQAQISHTVALMSCIILVCLQNLQSNPVAFQMLKTGTNLINDLETKVAEGSLTLTPSEVTLLEDYLKPILERLGTRYCFIVDLPSAFALHVDAKQKLGLQRTEAPLLPQIFNTLLEARNLLEMIAAWSVTNATSINPEFGVYCNKRDLVESLLTQWQDLLEAVDAAAYKEHPNLGVSKMLLKAAGLVTKILFDTLGSTQECIFDKHIHKFKEIVRIYDHVSQTSRAKRRQKVSFGIDTGIIHTLAFVIGRCRDPQIRRDALALMERDDHVEGDMRASTGLNVLKKLVELEEAGRSIRRQEDVLEQDRVRIWEDQQFWHSGLVKIYFIRNPYDPQRGASFQEVWVRMPIRINEELDRPLSPTQQKSHDLESPNVVFARGMAAFLDESTGTYHKIHLSSFFLPMPRM